MQSVNELIYGNKHYHARLLHSRINRDGGFTTEVYEARERSDTGMSRDVVLKVYNITAQDKRTQAHLRELIKREAQLMNKVHNEHLARLHDFHYESRTEMCLVIERIAGQTLAQHYEELEKLANLPDSHTIKNLVRIGVAVARALSDMHQHKPSIPHRDVTPTNIIFDKGFHKVKLIDFGLTALPAWPNEGTPGYRAPEQSPSGEELSIPDERCDVFGLGAVLYKGLTRKTPNVLPMRPVEAPMVINPDVPTSLNDFLLMMLAYDPGKRPSMREVREKLTKIRNNWTSLTSEEPTRSPNLPEERGQEHVYGATEHSTTTFSSGSIQPQTNTPPPQQHVTSPQSTPSTSNNTPLYDLYNAEFPIPALPPDPPAPPAPPEAMTPNPIGGASSRLIVGMAIMIVMLLLVIILLLFIR